MEAEGAQRSLKEVALAHVRTAILEGRYSPGFHLVEQNIANELGISRGPVRETLLQLEQEGLIQIMPRRGAVVRTISPREAWEIYLLRGHLEGLAVRLAARRWSPAHTAALQERLAEMRVLGPEDWARAVAVDLRFHHQIVDAAGHQHLQQMYRLMDGKVSACFMAVKHHLNYRPSDMADRHQRLVAVLAEGDFWRAELLAGDHWAETAARFKALEQSQIGINQGGN